MVAALGGVLVEACHGERVVFRGAKANPARFGGMQTCVVHAHDVLALFEARAVEVVEVLDRGAVAGQVVHHGLARLEIGREVVERPDLARRRCRLIRVIVIVEDLEVAQVDGLVGSVVHLEIGILLAIGALRVGVDLGDVVGSRLLRDRHLRGNRGRLSVRAHLVAGVAVRGDVPLDALAEQLA